MNLSEMRDEVLQEIGMAGDIEESLVDRWLNQGVTQIVLRTHCEIVTASVVLDVGQFDYESDSDVLSVVDLYNETDTRELTRETYSNLIRRRSRDAASTGPVSMYASKADTFLFYPVPSAETTIRIWYVPRPFLLAADDESPDTIPEEWHHLAVWWAMFRAASRDDDASSGQGERYRGFFDKGLMDMRKLMRLQGGHRAAPMRVNMREHNYVPSDPSRT